jgi:hypothetical protein
MDSNGGMGSANKHPPFVGETLQPDKITGN